MSRLALGLSLLVFAGPATAQNAAAWRDSAYRLSAEMLRVRDSLKQDDSRTEEIARRSGLVVSATSDYREIAEDVLNRFDTARRRWFGSALPGPAGFRITLRRGESWSFGQRMGVPQSLRFTGLQVQDDKVRAAHMVTAGSNRHAT